MSPAFQTAAELIAFHGKADATRIATAEVKRHAQGITPDTAPVVTFWAQVLSRLAGLTLEPAELQHLRASCSQERCAVLLRLGRAQTRKDT